MRSGSQTKRTRGRPAPKGFRQLGFPIAVGLILLAGVGLIAFVRVRESTAPPEPTPRGVKAFEELSRDHVEQPVRYEQIPPAGGAHFATPQTCGYYSKPVTTENAVHSLEHGAIWITYRPNLDKDAVERLKDLAGTKVLVSPWPSGLPSPIVASAWGRQLELREADDPRLQEFINRYRSAETAPEPAAACRGVGSPE